MHENMQRIIHHFTLSLSRFKRVTSKTYLTTLLMVGGRSVSSVLLWLVLVRVDGMDGRGIMAVVEKVVKLFN